MLPPSIPILEKSYSLEPDMIFGWMPKIKFKGPIPLNFDHFVVDSIIDETSNNPNYPLVYLGLRPSNSLELHDKLNENSQYKVNI